PPVHATAPLLFLPPTPRPPPRSPLFPYTTLFRSVYVLNDKQTYGFGVASTYRTAAKKLGITVAGFEGWDAKASSYEALATRIKRSEEHTSELQSPCNLVCRLLLEKKKKQSKTW